jgi:hypothetical protein
LEPRDRAGVLITFVFKSQFCSMSSFGSENGEALQLFRQ